MFAADSYVSMFEINAKVGFVPHTSWRQDVRGTTKVSCNGQECVSEIRKLSMHRC